MRLSAATGSHLNVGNHTFSGSPSVLVAVFCIAF